MNEAMTAVVEVLGLLGWVVGHSLWQGALVGAVLWGLLRVCRGPEKRYWLSCGAMGVLMVMVGATAVYLGQGEERRSSGVAVQERGGAVPEAVLPSGNGEIRWVGTVTAGGIDAGVRERVPAAVVEARGEEEVGRDWVGVFTVCGGVLWLVGVMGMAGVQIAGWRRVSRAMAGEDHAELTAVAERLMKKMGIGRRVRVLVERSWELGPGVVGWIKPVVLVPVSCATGLSAAQLEAVLAHELAHVKRNDYVVNLAVTAVETVMFHHPAVWWMGRVIRCERELCCDDLAREVCGGGRELAGALERMEEMRLGVGSGLVMGVNGGEGSGLLERVRRLMGRMEDPMDVRVSKAVWMVSVGGVVLLAVGCLAGRGEAKAAAEGELAEVATTTVEKAVVVSEAKPQTGMTEVPPMEAVTQGVPPVAKGGGLAEYEDLARAGEAEAAVQAKLDEELAKLQASQQKLTAESARKAAMLDRLRREGARIQSQAKAEIDRAQAESARTTMKRSAVEQNPSAMGQGSDRSTGLAMGSTQGQEVQKTERPFVAHDARVRTNQQAEAYRIVPGDVVQVVVGDLGRPGIETSRTVRVNELGQIQLPGVEGAVGLVGKSEEEARKVIAELYSAAGVKVKSADVTVSVVERNGWVVLVVGEVGMPGEVVLSKPEVRLLDVMARVKGATERAGGTVIVVSAGGERREVRIAELMQGKVEADVPVRAGDRVIVPGAATGQVGGTGAREKSSTANASKAEVEKEQQLQLSKLNLKLRDIVRTDRELNQVLAAVQSATPIDEDRAKGLTKLLERLATERDEVARAVGELRGRGTPGWFYLGGNVQRSGAYQLPFGPVSVKEALLRAGLVLPPESAGSVIVTRQWLDGSEETSVYPAADVFEGKHDDIKVTADTTIVLSTDPPSFGSRSTRPSTAPADISK